MIKIGIVGYGNLGRGVEAAVQLAGDMELTAVFTRRDPASVDVPVPVPVSEAVQSEFDEAMDAAVTAMPSMAAELYSGEE